MLPVISLLLAVSAERSLAAGGEGVPVSFILFQTFNFLIFLGLIVYFLSKKAPSFILRQYNDYMSMKNRAESLYRKTEKSIKDTQKKLLQIKEKSKRFDEELSLELEKMTARLNQDLKEQENSILRMAQNFVDQELVKLKTVLKKKFLNQVSALCQQSLKSEKQDSLFFAQKLKRRQ